MSNSQKPSQGQFSYRGNSRGSGNGRGRGRGKFTQSTRGYSNAPKSKEFHKESKSENQQDPKALIIQAITANPSDMKVLGASLANILISLPDLQKELFVGLIIGSSLHEVLVENSVIKTALDGLKRNQFYSPINLALWARWAKKPEEYKNTGLKRSNDDIITTVDILLGLGFGLLDKNKKEETAFGSLKQAYAEKLVSKETFNRIYDMMASPAKQSVATRETIARNIVNKLPIGGATYVADEVKKINVELSTITREIKKLGRNVKAEKALDALKQRETALLNSMKRYTSIVNVINNFGPLLCWYATFGNSSFVSISKAYIELILGYKVTTRESATGKYTQITSHISLFREMLMVTSFAGTDFERYFDVNRDWNCEDAIDNLYKHLFTFAINYDLVKYTGTENHGNSHTIGALIGEIYSVYPEFSREVITYAKKYAGTHPYVILTLIIHANRCSKELNEIGMSIIESILNSDCGGSMKYLPYIVKDKLLSMVPVSETKDGTPCGLSLPKKGTETKVDASTFDDVDEPDFGDTEDETSVAYVQNICGIHKLGDIRDAKIEFDEKSITISSTLLEEIAKACVSIPKQNHANLAKALIFDCLANCTKKESVDAINPLMCYLFAKNLDKQLFCKVFEENFVKYHNWTSCDNPKWGTAVLDVFKSYYCALPELTSTMTLKVVKSDGFTQVKKKAVYRQKSRCKISPKEKSVQLKQNTFLLDIDD